ncbi:MAG TPA: hypothetical protein VK184_20020 [Nostocaceae cyanobacterium]|nr:hypothetical protein [Nostocaceae cyanobacterium]
MSELGLIRTIENKEEIFKNVLTSLEIHRPTKTEAEQHIINQIQEKYTLPRRRNIDLWVNHLIKKNVSIEEFLDFVLQHLSPFVEMILDIYQFLSKYVSTTGGRTTHFEITDDLHQRILNFPDLNLPRKIQWIQTWTEIQIEVMDIVWYKIHKIFCFENGIFYGTVGDFRLLQSLIIARSKGQMSELLQGIANRIYTISHKILKSWFYKETQDCEHSYNTFELSRVYNQYRFVLSAYVPKLSNFLENRLTSSSNEINESVGIDLKVILFQNFQPYSLEEAFIDLNITNLVQLDCDDRNNNGLIDMVFFVALWGLDEQSFKKMTELLILDQDIFHNYEIEDLQLLEQAVTSQIEQAISCKYETEKLHSLGEEIISQIEIAIVYTGQQEKSIQNIKKKLEILLLPYWKDRWFLYEVWNLCFPLMEAVSINAYVDLLGVTSIINEDVLGTSWNLPTQKAKSPVAQILDATEKPKLWVWFQRETTRYDIDRKIEPDIRITLPWSPYSDMLILECKDRVKFYRKPALKVAENYLKGTASSKVWILNYELSPKKEYGLVELQEIGERQIGVVYGFRPGCIDKTIKQSICELFNNHLCIPKKKTQLTEHYLIIDSSGSMNGKILPKMSLFEQILKQNPQQIYYWNDKIHRISDSEARQILDQQPINGSGIENFEELRNFINTISPKFKITLITDILIMEFMENIEQYLIPLKPHLSDSHYAYKIGDKLLELIIL